MKPRLILHIGTHKTASTTLQAAMTDARDSLRACGILYPRTDRAPMAKQRKHAFLSSVLHQGGEAVAPLLQSLREEAEQAGAQTLLMSEEGLSDPEICPRPEAFVALAGAFDVTTVCFLRRQDGFAESLWNQRCKNARTDRHIDAFAAELLRGSHLHYGTMLETWGRVGRVVACSFEAARQEGVVEAFSRLSGVPLPPSPKDRNVSPGMRHAALMAVLNRMGVDHDHRQIGRILGHDLTRHALGARLRGDILAAVAEHNARLAAAWGVTFPDDVPDESADPIPPATEAEAQRYLARLARRGLADRPHQKRRAAQRAERRKHRVAAGRIEPSPSTGNLA
ncbi:MAG: hypothetical protein NTW20_14015 [Rhodobacterales bacterium]|nr:hypothetical protein [Rhodobacterales bacterium]